MRLTPLITALLLVGACGNKENASPNTTSADSTSKTSKTSPKTSASTATASKVTDKAVPTDAGAAAAVVLPDAAPPPTPLGTEFVEAAALMFRVIACGGDDEVPELYADQVEKHCVKVEDRFEKYRTGWVSKAKPFFEELVPKDLPTTIVYPFGGVDLVTALTVFPDATEITTLSLEPSGDPRLFAKLTKKDLPGAYATIRQMLDRLMAVSHSRTVDLAQVTKRNIPGHLLFSLFALSLHGQVPTSVRYFDIAENGDIVYVEDTDIEGLTDKKKLQALFSNMEIQFVPKDDPKAQPVVFRHIQADLGDDHLVKDRRVLAHLEAKGKVTAMTKAASYLLHNKEFSEIRNYLLANMVWMVSDSTGIPPKYAQEAGFEQETWGKYHGSFLKIGHTYGPAMMAMWKNNPQQELGFWFGYPDKNRNGHLLVTRPEAK